MPGTSLMIDIGLPFFLSMAIGALAAGTTDQVPMYLIGAGIAGLAAIITNLIGFQALVRHEGRVRTKLYDSVFASLIHKDLQFFVNEKVGALTSKFLDFVRGYSAIQDLLIIRTVGFVLSVTIGIIIVAVNAPILAAVLLILFFAIITVVQVFTKIRKPYRHKRKKLVAQIHGEVADSITNSLIVKTFAHEKKEQSHLHTQLKKLEHIFIKDISLIGYDGTTRIAIMVATQIIGISLSVYLVASGELSLAIAIFALTYLQRIAGQIFGLGELLHGYDEALLQAAPLSDILMKEITVFDMPQAKKYRITDPSIELDGMSYAYTADGERVLKEVSLQIPAGQKVGLVGQSGAGKTTITHLLLRFADVTDGAIKINGRDVRDYTQQSLRSQIAYVPQEPMLFHRSIRENIAYGLLGASEKEIRKTAEQANALEFIDKLPEGLDTLVGERGVKLSGGQKQRIAIARAILKNAPILVLDEATSALDSESEKLIQDALGSLMEGRTSIVIAHRLSTIAKLDRIVVLDKGEIIEDGSHQELLSQKGRYAKLWAHQSGGFIEE